MDEDGGEKKDAESGKRPFTPQACWEERSHLSLLCFLSNEEQSVTKLLAGLRRGGGVRGAGQERGFVVGGNDNNDKFGESRRCKMERAGVVSDVVRGLVAIPHAQDALRKRLA